MAPTLALRNPSNYPRQGFVATPWAALARAGVSPEELLLSYRTGNPLRAQVDKIDPDDQERTVLVFELDEDVPAGEDDYSQVGGLVRVARGAPVPEAGPTVCIEPTGFKLINERIELWFNLAMDEGDDRPWLAGAASSVQLDRVELLDNFRALASFLGHDPEKRCMQVDRIRIPRPPWEATPEQEQNLLGTPYELIAHSAGPVRATVTIASAPFEYSFQDPLAPKKNILSCRLYRVISLYRGIDYVIEELFLKGVPAGKAGGPGVAAIPLSFAAHYFLHMDLGLMAQVTHLPEIPDWFALGCDWDPFQGYGFATDVHAGLIASPHPGFPRAESRHKSFSWDIGLGRQAKCLHLFKRCKPRELAHEAGRAWYLHIFKPLRADFVA